MVMCTTTMDSVIIPRPPAPPLSLLKAGIPLPPPPPPPAPPKPLIDQFIQTELKDFVNAEVKTFEEQTINEERRITQHLVEKNISKNESVRSKISGRSSTSHKSNGFRLKDANNKCMTHQANSQSNQTNDDTSSIYSIYKQKIDSMFESDSSHSPNLNHNSVQAKIEKMFSDVANDGSGSNIPSNSNGTSNLAGGIHAFSVDYLGSVALQDKVTSLAGLQDPLKDLYFSYKKMIRNKTVLSGRLEISSQGLRVQYQGESGDLEQMNSFPTIAVWSAVKFVIQQNTNGKNPTYAFLPLITDPDNMDKQTLFRNLENDDRKFINREEHSPLFAVVMRKIGVQKQLECHGFVCQTSEDAIVIAATLYKSLVNHMKIKEKRLKNKNGLTTCMSTASSTIIDKHSIPVRPPRRKRGSTASSICSDTNSITNVSDTQPLLPLNKPPKKSTKQKRAPTAPSSDSGSKQDDLDAIVSYEEPISVQHDEEKLEIENDSTGNDNEVKEIKPKTFTDKLNIYMSKEQKQITAEIKQVVTDSNKGLRSVQSLRDRNEDLLRKKENSGDIFTKVTIPRSGSFLNTGGLTRYKGKLSRNNETSSGGSPLGFKEIFNELSLQEGLHSMDDILSVIIDPDGMSFNDLKPIYKEFLLKLAVTLTKDELYMKSKSIMRRQKKKMIKRAALVKRNPHILVSSKFKRLRHIFQKNCKSKSADSKKRNLSHLRNERATNQMQVNSKHATESSISTSSYDTRQFRTKEELAAKKTTYKKKNNGEFNKHRKRDRTSTSEESDFFSLKRQQKLKSSNSGNLLTLNHNRNSSSGYVSCSECSYDSDTCTCVSADKCYCSMGEKNDDTNDFQNKRLYSRENRSLSYCDCDTDSCAESNKCYCHFDSGKSGMSNWKNRSVSQISHHPNCSRNGNGNKGKHKKLCKKVSNTKSSKSLEYMPNPSESYYEKLRSKNKYGSERVLTTQYTKNSLPKKRRNSHLGITDLHGTSSYSQIITQQEIQMGLLNGKLSPMDCELLKFSNKGLNQAVFKDDFTENLKNYWNGTRINGGFGRMDTSNSRVQSAITTGACTEALSVKKSAEIAALFADMKLSQTTDITHFTPNQNIDLSRMIYAKNLYNNKDRNVQAKYSKPNKPSSTRLSTNHDIHLTGPPQLPPPCYGRPANLMKNKTKMYSSKNGLYTIQSQSDESRTSSISGGENRKNLERYGSRKSLSMNIENSLGYLP